MQENYQSTSQNASGLSAHAKQRMFARGLSEDAISAALTYGRIVHTRGAEIHAIGRKEVGAWREKGVDLEPMHGLQVVCAPDGTILTVYKNRDFRSLRPTRKGRSFRGRR